jgi:O-antigen/teichoic acid export membrane protein
VGLVIRQSLKSTLLTYFGVGIGALNLLYFFPRYLNPELIGLRELLLGVALSLSIFTQLGMQSAMSRFFPYFQDSARQHNGFLLFTLGVVALGLLAFGGLFRGLQPWWQGLFADKSAIVNAYWGMILPLTGMMMLQNVLEIWARLHYRIVVNALLREIGLRVALTGLTVAYAKGLIGLDGFLWGMCASYGVSALLLAGYLQHMGVLYLNPAYVRVRRALRPIMIRYSLWMIVGGAGVIINERIDGLMLAWLAGLASTGIYSLSFFIGTIIEMPRRSVSQIAGTLITHAWKAKDYAALAQLHRQAALNQMLIGGILLVLIWTQIDTVFDLMPNGNVYREGKWVVLWIGLARWFDMSNGVNTEIILNSPFYRFNLISIILLGIISFTANYLLIPVYGLTGAAAGSTLSILLFNLLKGGFLWFRLGFQPFNMQNVKALGLLLLIYAVGLAMNLWGKDDQIILGTPGISGELLWKIIGQSTGMLILFSVLLYRWKISPEINGLMESLWRRTGWRKA